MSGLRQPRILILHASVGSGHTRAAQAAHAALKELAPQAHVECVDVLELANIAFRKVYGAGYINLAASAPHLLGYLYDLSDKPESTGSVSDSFRRFVQNVSLRAFRKFLRDGRWDVILSTHFLPSEIIALLKRRGILDSPHAVTVTDFEAHRFWASFPCEQFFVATEDSAASLRHLGVRDENISVTGIPIQPAFARLPDRRVCLRGNGLSGKRPILLQLAGGFGMGPIEEIYKGLLSVEFPSEIIVVTGRNEKVRHELCGLSAPQRHQVHILGYTERMHELMAVADVVVTKPGGLTTSEAMACGVPMVIVSPIPGQESRNCDYLLENGAGIKINGVSSISEKLTALLSDQKRLNAMRDHARIIGRPGAAFDVSRKVLEMAKNQIVCSTGSGIPDLQPLHSAAAADIPLRIAMTAKTAVH